MDEGMDVDGGLDLATVPQEIPIRTTISSSIAENLAPMPPTSSPRDNFRDIQVKVHIRRPERDSWVYLGRGVVTQEVSGHSSRVVVRGSTGKVIAIFSEGSDLQAEKRGNFVVVGCVEGSRVVSWSLNALNNAETLRLLASIELACYKCKQAIADPRLHNKARRRIERVIKDDRRRRHRRRKEQEAMIDAFAKQTLSTELPIDDVPPPPPE
ncbi:hypothetical protein PC9H_003575 [Pleurotus ostreatus]|uniref:Uncharacterized protein n=3 Tax=Pleurotus TaxID=5320 RepID=A0A8H7A268_PLEOS|nr:uncharacterized protein PC9H_003575 [Pleurotus ostreatus]KAF7436742.1 hypothetical protein PC9H_003575 [Pleurotus ostreatus]KAG9222735.1 hypothetical protein CCMSSC00406_0004649 [Pleurotus cornucopiae]